jgi:C1A family cysteine protease
VLKNNNMENSIFKGHILKENDSKSLYESNNNFHISNPFDEKVNKLAEYGITDWEQLYSLLKNDSIKGILKNALNVQSDEEITVLKNICENVLPTNTIQRLNQIEIINCPLGTRRPKVIETITEKFKANHYIEVEEFIKSDRKLNEIKSFDSFPAFNLANSINHIRQLNAIRDQGLRGTCTSFAVTVANEFSIFKKTGQRLDLSEQHLYFETKILEEDEVCGSWIKNSMQVISNKGQCREGVWSYNPNLPCAQPYGKPSNADSDATSFKNTFLVINQNNIVALKQTLSSGRIIPFSIPVYDSWYKSSETYRTGRITMPLPDELESGGHSMVLVGYQDDINYPGGGYFLIRNSWGKDWARESYYGAGYGIIPYLYIENYNWEAFAF